MQPLHLQREVQRQTVLVPTAYTGQVEHAALHDVKSTSLKDSLVAAGHDQCCQLSSNHVSLLRGLICILER